MAYVTLSSKAIGSTIKLKVNGSAKDFIVVHQGKPSSVYDDSCNGTWLLMKDIYENRQWHSSNTNDYANSTIHSYLNSTFLNLFESNIKNAIKQVKLPYRKGSGTSTTVTSGSNGLSAKISCSVRPKRVSASPLCRAVKARSWPISRAARTTARILSVSHISTARPPSGGSALRAATSSTTPCASAPMAAGASATAPSRTASAPL